VRRPNISHCLAPQAGGVEPSGDRPGKGGRSGHKPPRQPSPDTGPNDINRPEFVKKSKVIIIISRYKRVNRPHSARRKVVGKPCRPCLVFSFFRFFSGERDGRGGNCHKPPPTRPFHPPMCANHEHPRFLLCFLPTNETGVCAAERVGVVSLRAVRRACCEGKASSCRVGGDSDPPSQRPLSLPFFVQSEWCCWFRP